MPSDAESHLRGVEPVSVHPPAYLDATLGGLQSSAGGAIGVVLDPQWLSSTAVLSDWAP